MLSMESIFESLENLNVSEECFKDIVGLVEQFLSETTQDQIKKVHGDPVWDETHEPLNKAAELISKAKNIQNKEYNEASARRNRAAIDIVKKKYPEITKPPVGDWREGIKYSTKIHNLAIKEPTLYDIRTRNKNYDGARKTENRRYEWEEPESCLGTGIHKGRQKGYPANDWNEKSDEQRVEGSIARHKAKQEKKNKNKSIN